MWRHHLEALAPLCPACLDRGADPGRVFLSQAWRENSGWVEQGLLQCAAADCLTEFPILDGIPLLVADPRSYVEERLDALVERDDLGHGVEMALLEAAGHHSRFGASRLHASMYVRDHYGEFDPAESGSEPLPGAIAAVWREGTALLGAAAQGPVLEQGCCVGRTCLEWARRVDGPVLGIDLDFAFLRRAVAVLRTQTVRYARRSHGLLHERREFSVPLPDPKRIDYWVADAVRPPFAAATFGTVSSLHVIDCVAAPLQLLQSARELVREGGHLLIASPYDWAGHVSDPSHWIGGHSPRAPRGGDSAALLRDLLTGGAHPASVQGFEVIEEIAEVPWHVRQHDRSATHYRVHVLAARRGPGNSTEEPLP